MERNKVGQCDSESDDESINAMNGILVGVHLRSRFLSSSRFYLT